MKHTITILTLILSLFITGCDRGPKADIYIMAEFTQSENQYFIKKFYLTKDNYISEAQVIRPMTQKGFMGFRYTKNKLDPDYDWLSNPVHHQLFLPIKDKIKCYYLFYQKYLPKENPTNVSQKPKWGCKILYLKDIKGKIEFDKLEEIENSITINAIRSL